MSRQPNHLSGNGSPGVSRNLTTRAGMTYEDSDDDANRTGAIAGLLTEAPAWSFDGVADDGPASDLLVTRFDSDNSSTKVEGDNDSGFGSDRGDWEDTDVRNSPIERDDHEMPEYSAYTQRLEVAGGEEDLYGDVVERPVDIHLDDSTPVVAADHEHDEIKMD